MILFFINKVLFMFLSTVMITLGLRNLYLPTMSKKQTIRHLLIAFIIVDGINVIVQLLPLKVEYKNFFVALVGAPLITLVNLILLISYNKERKFYSFIVAFLDIMIFLLSDNIAGNFYIYMFGFSVEFVINNVYVMIGVYVITISLTLTITKLVGKLLKKIRLEELSYRYKPAFQLTIGINIITALSITYFNAMLNKYLNTDKTITIINVGMFSIYLLSAIISIFFYSSYLKKEIELEKNKKEFENITQYTTLIENMYEETRKFKHDYMNILISLDGYIESNDMKLLKDYFNKHIITTQNVIHEKNGQIQRLKYIKQIPIKALISSKLVKAQTEDIDINVDIIEDIEDINMNIIDICRIMGILFDNAIEACSVCYRPKIQFSVVKKYKTVIIILANSCSSDTPPIYKMFEKGFSTKGENRGLGLNNVKEIISEKYQNVILNTSIEDKIFKQELWIKNI